MRFFISTFIDVLKNKEFEQTMLVIKIRIFQCTIIFQETHAIYQEINKRAVTVHSISSSIGYCVEHTMYLFYALPKDDQIQVNRTFTICTIFGL